VYDDLLLEMPASRKGFREKPQKLGIEFECGKKLLSGLLRHSRVGRGGVQLDGLAQAVEIGRAVRTVFQVTFKSAALGRRELGIELLTNVVQDIVATDSFLFHAVM
jgi:hypothetical protein